MVVYNINMTIDKPLISIIIPVYNSGDTISRCVDSCLRQSFSNIEIICINDGSKDNSLSILNNYSSLDKRVKVFSQKNKGPSKARNKGIKKAIGNYLIFLDSDDFLEDNACEILLSYAEKYKTNVIIFNFKKIMNNMVIDSSSIDINDMHFFKIVHVEDFLSLPYMIPYSSRCFFAKQHIMERECLYDAKITIGDDAFFQFNILPLSTNVLAITNRLYNYVQNNKSLTHTKTYHDFFNRTLFHIKLLKKIYYSWLDRGMFKGSEVLFFEWSMSFIFNTYKHLDPLEKYAASRKMLFLLKKIDSYKRILPSNKHFIVKYYMFLNNSYFSIKKEILCAINKLKRIIINIKERIINNQR